MTTLAEYWDQRARDYASRGAGLRAVCSYGMPSFYSGYIQLTQRLALARHLRIKPGTEVLDLGCGIGRWSRLLARRGAKVTGVDVAASMLEEARRRTAKEGLTDRIDYRLGDLSTFSLDRKFDLVLSVTVVQHILDDDAFALAIRNVAKHLAPNGRAVMLEAAPSRPDTTCDTSVFRARTAAQYLHAFENAGLRAVRVTGVDPAPLKKKVLPRYRRMPPLAAKSMIFLATALSLPIDALLGRRLPHQSWHKVFLLEHDG